MGKHGGRIWNWFVVNLWVLGAILIVLGIIKAEELAARLLWKLWN